VRRWKVSSFTDPGKEPYVVAQKTNGSWGCSCPAWKFRKAHPDCKHITEIKLGLKTVLVARHVVNPIRVGRFSILDF
jgi:hypothetical protein